MAENNQSKVFTETLIAKLTTLFDKLAKTDQKLDVKQFVNVFGKNVVTSKGDEKKLYLSAGDIYELYVTAMPFYINFVYKFCLTFRAILSKNEQKMSQFKQKLRAKTPTISMTIPSCCINMTDFRAMKDNPGIIVEALNELIAFSSDVFDEKISQIDARADIARFDKLFAEMRAKSVKFSANDRNNAVETLYGLVSWVGGFVHEIELFINQCDKKMDDLMIRV